MDEEEWKAEILADRENKDRFFKSSWQSPLDPEDQKRFEGLKYFPLDIKYRFEVPLKEYEKKEIIEIQDTGENMRHYLRWGEFDIEIDGNPVILHVYKAKESDPYLFLPIRDATSGKETYGAGRYLDLEYGRDQTDDGKWIIDLNKLYNPFCAYSDNYVCPFVPIENWLKVPIKAGEMDLGLH